MGFFPRTPEVVKYTQKSWIQSAKFSRTSGHLQVAWSSLVKAKERLGEKDILLESFVEQAKYHWANCEQKDAMRALDKGIKQYFPDLLIADTARNSQRSQTEKLSFIKAQLLMTQYAWEAQAMDGKEIRRIFDTIICVGQTEQVWYKFAMFVDKPDIVKRDNCATEVYRLVRLYMNALNQGSHHVYHCLPRMLTLWLDFGQRVLSVEREKVKGQNDKKAKDLIRNQLVEMRQYLEKINRMIKQMVSDQRDQVKVPLTTLYAGFSQLISRITHPEPTVYEALKVLLQRIMCEFPAQCLWLSVSVYKHDKSSQKHKRCQELYEVVSRAGGAQTRQLMDDTVSLADRLMELANARSQRTGPHSLRNLCPVLSGFLGGKGGLRSQILIPLHSLMEVSLVSLVGVDYSTGHSQDLSGLEMTSKHVCIQEIEDAVEVLQSMQAPKRITLRGSDGNIYRLLCKPSDDLHKTNDSWSSTRL